MIRGGRTGACSRHSQSLFGIGERSPIGISTEACVALKLRQVAALALFIVGGRESRVNQDVWLNLSSGIYHFKGQRCYANINNGAFVCEQEAAWLATGPP